MSVAKRGTVFATIIGIMALAFVLVPAVLAGGNSIELPGTPFTSGNCKSTVGLTGNTFVSNSPSRHTYGQNISKNLSTGTEGAPVTYSWSTPNEGVTNWTTNYPADILPGDVVRFTLSWYSNPARTELFYTAWVDYVCNTGVIIDYGFRHVRDTVDQPTYPWYYAPSALPSTTLAMYQQVPYDGMMACGVFDVGWWEIKYVAPDQFPGCADYLPDHVEIACFTADGTWTKNDVSLEHVNGDGFYGATIKQHGTCGVFPME